MQSFKFRSNPLFIRNSYPTYGKWGIPIIKRQSIDLNNISLIACSDTRCHDNKENCNCGVHFFVDDYRFKGIVNNPNRTLQKFSQYKFLLTTDDSLFADMNLWQQINSIGQSRWLGAFWQEHNLTVIATISWSTPRSFEFCFDGIEQGSIVAIGMIGCKREHRQFMQGYDAMLERINPEAIICFGSPFREMRGNIIPINYQLSRKVVR